MAVIYWNGAGGRSDASNDGPRDENSCLLKVGHESLLAYTITSHENIVGVNENEHEDWQEPPDESRQSVQNDFPGVFSPEMLTVI